MSAAPSDFDLSAAWLRRAKGDLPAFVEALAVRLSDALPDAVTVERQRDGFFSRTSHVSRIAVRTAGGMLALDVQHGGVRATRVKVVRSVMIGSEEIPVPVWLEEVLRCTRAVGADADAAHDAIHAFLMS